MIHIKLTTSLLSQKSYNIEAFIGLSQLVLTMLIISTVLLEIESKDSETGALWYVRIYVINISMPLLRIPENTVLTFSGITFH